MNMNDLKFDTIASNETNENTQNKIVRKWGILQRVVFAVRHFKCVVVSKLSRYLKTSRPYDEPNSRSYSSELSNAGTSIIDLQGGENSTIPIMKKIGDIVSIKSR